MDAVMVWVTSGFIKQAELKETNQSAANRGWY